MLNIIPYTEKENNAVLRNLDHNVVMKLSACVTEILQQEKPTLQDFTYFAEIVDYTTSLHMYFLQFFSFRAIPKIIGYFMWM